MADNLIEWYTELAEESAAEAVELVKRLKNLAGDRPLGSREIKPFEIWANASRILDSDEELAAYAAQAGWRGVQALTQLREKAVKRGKIGEAKTE